jgi:uncharacterized protein YegL
MSISDTGAVESIPIFFLIDTTSSMKGEAIDAVNTSLRIYVDQVKKRSYAAASHLSLCLIGFDGEARIILPPTLLRDADLPRIEASESSATLLAGALQLAVQLAPHHRVLDDQLKPVMVVLLDGLAQDRKSIEFLEALESIKVRFGEKFVFAALPISRQSAHDFLPENTIFSYVCDEDFVGAMFHKVAEYCFNTYNFDYVNPTSANGELPGSRENNQDQRLVGTVPDVKELTGQSVIGLTEQAVERQQTNEDKSFQVGAIKEVDPPISANTAAARWVSVWLPPYGTGTGLRFVNKSFSLSSNVASNGAEIEFKVSHLPIAGMYSFLAVSKDGYPAVCLAIPRRNGALAVSFSHLEGNLNWEIFETELDHHALPSSNLSLDAWSAAVLANKNENLRLLIPSDEGPCVVDIDFVKRRYTTELAKGRCLGGVAKIQSSAYVPVFRNGKLEIACIKGGGWTYWTPDGNAPADALSFGCPIVLEPMRKAIWVSKDGYLLMERGRVSFNAWPTGWVAKTEFGPPFENAEGYWQLCFNPSMETFKYAYLLIEKSRVEIKSVDGPRMNTGKLCVSKKSIYKNAPWGEPEQFGKEPFIIPLLQSSDNLLYLGVNIEKSPETVSMTSLIDSYENYHFNIREKSSAVPLMTGRGPTPWRASFFIFGDLLNFYLESQGEIYSWIVEK